MTNAELIAELSTRDPAAEVWVHLNVSGVTYAGAIEAVTNDGPNGDAVLEAS